MFFRRLSVQKLRFASVLLVTAAVLSDSLAMSNPAPPEEFGRRATETQGQHAKSPDTVIPKPEEVLTESYYRSTPLFPAERAFVLGFLVDAGASLRDPRTIDWAKEDLRIAESLPVSWNTLALKKNLLIGISSLDPRSAMESLCGLSSPVPLDNGSLPEDVRADSAKRIFPAFWRQTGYLGLEEVTSVSLCLAQSGQFPFDGILPVIKSLAVNHSEEADQLFFTATSYIGSHREIEGTSAEVADFLIQLRGVISDNYLREGYQTLLNRLAEEKTANKWADRHPLFRTISGKEARQFDSEADFVLARILPELHRIDPALAEKTVEDSDGLFTPNSAYTPIDRTEQVMAEGSEDSTAVAQVQATGLQQSRLTTIQSLASSHPDKAIGLLNTISDPAIRAEGAAAVASALSDSNSKDASAVLSQSEQQLSKVKDVTQLVTAATPVVEALAVRKDYAAMRQIFRRAFRAGVDEWTKELELKPVQPAFAANCVDGLMSLTETGARYDPLWTLSEVRSLDVSLQSYLLISVAKGLAESNAKG